MQANAQHPPAPPHSPAQIQYPRCIECVSKWYRKTIQYRSPDGAKNVSKRACIERVSNKKCLDTVSRGVYRKSRYTYDTLRYTSIHFDAFMGKSHPDTWGKWPRLPDALTPATRYLRSVRSGRPASLPPARMVARLLHRGLPVHKHLSVLRYLHNLTSIHSQNRPHVSGPGSRY